MGFDLEPGSFNRLQITDPSGLIEPFLVSCNDFSETRHDSVIALRPKVKVPVLHRKGAVSVAPVSSKTLEISVWIPTPV